MSLQSFIINRLKSNYQRNKRLIKVSASIIVLGSLLNSCNEIFEAPSSPVAEQQEETQVIAPETPSEPAVEPAEPTNPANNPEFEFETDFSSDFYSSLSAADIAGEMSDEFADHDREAIANFVSKPLGLGAEVDTHMVTIAMDEDFYEVYETMKSGADSFRSQEDFIRYTFNTVLPGLGSVERAQAMAALSGVAWVVNNAETAAEQEWEPNGGGV